MSRILAIDPGLANTGLVMFEGRRIVAVTTVTTKSSGPRPEFTSAVARSFAIAEQVGAWAREVGDPDVVVAEAYIDLGGSTYRVRDGKSIPNRWTTPLAIGVMVPTLYSLTDRVVWQDPDRVMGAYAQAKRLWAIGQRGICGGDELLRNDHQRSAACHGLFYLSNERMLRQ